MRKPPKGPFSANFFDGKKLNLHIILDTINTHWLLAINILNWYDVQFAVLGNKKGTHDLTQILYLQAIAGAGFEPATSGLWAVLSPKS